MKNLNPAAVMMTAGSLLLMAATPSAAQEEREVRVIVNQAVDCEGDDCGGAAIFIDDDGNVSRVGGEGHVWVSADGEEGDGPHVIQLHANEMHSGDGNAFVFRTGGSGGYLGVQLSELTDQLRGHFGVPDGEGVMVSEVVAGSPAEAAGLRAGDVITGVNSKAIRSSGALGQKIRALEDGETASLEVWRDGSVQTLTAQVEAREGSGGMHKVIRQMIHCEDGEDCTGDLGERLIEIQAFGGDHGGFEVHAFDASEFCGEGEECRIEVSCEEPGDCECIVNGEATDCGDLHEN